MNLLEIVILYALAIWSLVFLVNHAEITAKVRHAVMPVLPLWMQKLLQCAFCFAFWLLAALSLFTGWTPLILWVPPVTLGMDLAYRRLSVPVATGPAKPEEQKN